MAEQQNFNYLALRGGNVDDMEFVDQFGLDPAVAYTPKINDVMLEQVYNENVAAGTEPAVANKNRREAQHDIKKMLAKKGMLK